MYYLGLDTSNYTTSVAVVRGEEILCDERIQLKVRPGEKGLRQSEALYQHWQNLPFALRDPLQRYGKELTAVCVSCRPRPVEGSYMPVFQAGVSAARILSDALGIPFHETSHQEGHLRAAAFGTAVDFGKPLLAAHLSGGTLEWIRIASGVYEVVGGTRDLSYGQLLDRTGVLLGLDFPAGKALDQFACSCVDSSKINPLGPVFRDQGWINLSGTETQIKELAGHYETAELAAFLFSRIGESLAAVAEHLRLVYKIDQVLITGGVAASRYLRDRCRKEGYQFGAPALCGDNAAGVALLKGQPLWPSNR
jgi:N6-L-threonylcarbamoyladenine synthase